MAVGVGMVGREIARRMWRSRKSRNLLVVMWWLWSGSCDGLLTMRGMK